ncbi:MAG: BrnA antitoxin family protein [Acidimicrobiaceae bacterium]|nr:BrnA antitoxin family protein [Acidimicrobiaceae bacterium]MDE0319322.1 BrnA antitoxin family protein [Acidimicrobiaceae bacterium]MDE0499617.1 BrnA antitoxin family protein [Acidimicrobiaceae bacterium]
MNENDASTAADFDHDTAPDLSRDPWPDRFAKARVARGRPPVARPKVSTTIRLSQDVIDHFRAGGRGWQTRIDEALRDWIAEQPVA